MSAGHQTAGNHAKVPGIRVRLPATSANLGPGFDAVGLAMSLALTVEARAAAHDRVEATGRDAERCGTVENNLILKTYREVMEGAGKGAGSFVPGSSIPPRSPKRDPPASSGQALGHPPAALHLKVENEIPLGMGCGSSAAARLAGVALANHFGGLGMDAARMVAEASRSEGHPDNVAACWYGGFTVSVPSGDEVAAATFPCDGTWQMVLALPQAGLATEEARAVLAQELSRADAVFNVQRAALLTAAFAQGRLDLLRVAMEDRLHQPQRRRVCGLLEHLERLHHAPEFAGVALSGAGPALLAILSERATLHAAEQRLRTVLGDGVELLPVRIGEAATVEVL